MTYNQSLGYDKLSQDLGLELKWNREKLHSVKDILLCTHWSVISASDNIIWDQNILIEFEYDLDWERLAQNKSIPWSFDFCKSIRAIIPWNEFSEYFVFYSGLEKEMIKFLDEFKFEIDWKALSSNQKIKWSLIFENDYNTGQNAFALFIEFWNPEKLSSNLVIWGFQNKIIKLLNEKIDWKTLSENPNFKWTDVLLEMHKNHLNWYSISRMSKKTIPWSISLLEKFKGEVVWGTIANNASIPFSLELVLKFESYWEDKKKDYYPSNGYYWGLLSKNIGGKFEMELLLHFRNKWHWDELLLNKNILWTVELLEQFVPEICAISSKNSYYDNLMMNVLQYNEDIPFSLTILTKLETQWTVSKFNRSTKRNGYYSAQEWFMYSHNNFINADIIRKYGKYLNIGTIINNSKLNWNSDLIKAIINIDIPECSNKYSLGQDEECIYEQDWIDKEIGFPRTKINIIKELIKHDYVIEIIYEEVLMSFIIEQR